MLRKYPFSLLFLLMFLPFGMPVESQDASLDQPLIVYHEEGVGLFVTSVTGDENYLLVDQDSTRFNILAIP
jgi:hypothetical protein